MFSCFRNSHRFSRTTLSCFQKFSRDFQGLCFLVFRNSQRFPRIMLSCFRNSQRFPRIMFLFQKFSEIFKDYVSVSEILRDFQGLCFLVDSRCEPHLQRVLGRKHFHPSQTSVETRRNVIEGERHQVCNHIIPPAPGPYHPSPSPSNRRGNKNESFPEQIFAVGVYVWGNFWKFAFSNLRPFRSEKITREIQEENLGFWRDYYDLTPHKQRGIQINKVWVGKT